MRTTGKGLLLLTLFLVAPTSVLSEIGSTRLPREVGGESVRVARLEPRISKKLPSRARRSLASAFELAAERLRSRSECQSLFDDLGADGLEVLAQGLYYGVGLQLEQRTCRGTSAFTQVGGRVTRVCSSFGRLRKNQAAVVLIHEALHQAGMGEKPRDPQALDSAQINQLVSDRCGL